MPFIRRYFEHKLHRTVRHAWPLICDYIKQVRRRMPQALTHTHTQALEQALACSCICGRVAVCIRQHTKWLWHHRWVSPVVCIKCTFYFRSCAIFFLISLFFSLSLALIFFLFLLRRKNAFLESVEFRVCVRRCCRICTART